MFDALATTPIPVSDSPTILVGMAATIIDLLATTDLVFDTYPNWTSSSPAVLVVSGEGILTTVQALTAGSAILTADGPGGTISFTVKAIATSFLITLSPSSVYTRGSSTASLTPFPSGAGLDGSGITWAAGDASGITVTGLADGTAAVLAGNQPGTFAVLAHATSNLQGISGSTSLTVLQGYTGLQLANSAQLNPQTFGYQVALGGTFTLTPRLIPPGCTAPIDSNSWTVTPSKAGNTVAIEQSTGVVTVTAGVLGSWSCSVGFTSNGTAVSTSNNTSVSVLAAATGIQIAAFFPDGTVFGPGTVTLIQGRVGQLSASAVSVGQGVLDGPPSWGSSSPSVAAVSPATGYRTQLTVLSASGTTTITCSGTSGGNAVTGTLDVTALKPATGLIVAVTNTTPVVGVSITATATASPVPSYFIGNPQWSYATPTGGSPGAVTITPNANGTATITPTAPGTVTIAADAATPAGVVVGFVRVTIGGQLSAIFLVTRFQSFSSATPITVYRSAPFVCTATPVPGNVVVDTGSWSVSVLDEDVATAAINANTGALTITMLASEVASTVVSVSVSTGSGSYVLTVGFRVNSGAISSVVPPIVAAATPTTVSVVIKGRTVVGVVGSGYGAGGTGLRGAAGIAYEAEQAALAGGATAEAAAAAGTAAGDAWLDALIPDLTAGVQRLVPDPLTQAQADAMISAMTTNPWVSLLLSHIN